MALFFCFPLLLWLPAVTAQQSTDPVTQNRIAGRPVQALYHLEAAAARDGWSVPQLQLAGDLWAEMGDVPRAVMYWSAAAEALPDDTVLARQLADANITLQRWPQALDYLDRLLDAAPDNRWANFHAGIIRSAYDPLRAQVHLAHVTEGEYGALAAQVLALLQRSDAETLPLRVGLALVEAEQWPYAELALQHAVTLTGEPVAMAYVGFARDRQGKDARQWFEQALYYGPEQAVVYYLYGLYLRADAPEASRDALVRAVAWDPQNPAYYAELSTAYQLVGDQQNAERWLRVAVDISGQDARFSDLLTLFLLDNALDSADPELQFLESLAVAEPQNPDVQAGYGWALYLNGDTEAALNQLEGVLAEWPDQPRALYYKAEISVALGDVATARQLYEQVRAQGAAFSMEAARILEGLP